MIEASWRPGEPAYLSFPADRVGSMGDDVAAVAVMMHRPLDPHQLVSVDAIGSYGAGGRWSTLESCVVGPRQTTGKTSGIVLPTVCHDLLTRPRSEPARCIWTSHRMKTTLDTFRDLKEIIAGSEEFSRRVARISEKDGDESVYFTNGSWVEFSARSPGAGRGLAAEIVVPDEALYLSSTMAGDLLPAMASKSNPRVIYASSAPKADSEQLHSLVARGRAGDPTLCYVEFRCPGRLDDEACQSPRCDHSRDAVGCRLDDEDLWPYGSPGLASGRCSITVVRALRRALEPLEFAREMLGWEEDPEAGADTIPLEKLAARVDPESRVDPQARPVFAFDVSPDGRSASIGVCGRREDGVRHLGLVDNLRGVTQLVPRLRELVSRHDPVALVLDGASPAAAMLPTLLDPDGAGWSIRTEADPGGLLVVTTASDMGKACVGLLNAFVAEEAEVWHRGDPLVTKAFEVATRREIGDGGWGLARKRSDGDITPAVVFALAHYGHAVHGASDYDLAGSFG